VEGVDISELARVLTTLYRAAADLDVDTGCVGGNSTTNVVKATAPPPRQKGEIIEGETPEEVAEKLVAKLRDNQVI